MERRLEAGWFQRIAWSALVWGSLGFLAWVPFLYVAIRRARPSDWGAFAAFTLYEVMTMVFSARHSGTDGNTTLGALAVVTWLIATAMLLFAVFDKRSPKQLPFPPMHGTPQGPQLMTPQPSGQAAPPAAPGNGYGYHPYGR